MLLFLLVFLETRQKLEPTPETKIESSILTISNNSLETPGNIRKMMSSDEFPSSRVSLHHVPSQSKAKKPSLAGDKG